MDAWNSTGISSPGKRLEQISKGISSSLFGRSEMCGQPVPHRHVRMCVRPADSSPSKPHPSHTHPPTFPWTSESFEIPTQRYCLLNLNKGTKALGVETSLWRRTWTQTFNTQVALLKYWAGLGFFFPLTLSPCKQHPLLCGFLLFGANCSWWLLCEL